MSFLFLAAAFVAVTNAGRVGVARLEAARSPALPLVVGFIVVAAAALLAEELLDLLAISPESFRIAAGLVLAATGLWTLVTPMTHTGPLVAALVTPELAVLAISAGADEPVVEVLAAAAIGFALVVPACLTSRREVLVPAARFLCALQVIVAVALVVSGVRDV